MSNPKIIEQIIEELIYCYLNRTHSEEKIKILKEHHWQNFRDDMRCIVRRIVSAKEWICPEIDLKKEQTAFWIAICLDLIQTNKEGKIITNNTVPFQNNVGWLKNWLVTSTRKFRKDDLIYIWEIIFLT